MLKVVYISSNAAVEKPKKSVKQKFIEDALETLARREHHDMLRAKEMFASELAELKKKQDYYEELSKKIAHLI